MPPDLPRGSSVLPSLESQRYKDFPPGWGHLRIPTSSRQAALAGLSLYTPCHSRGIWVQRAARMAVRIVGPHALPGRALEWRPPVEMEVWLDLCGEWRKRVGVWDAMAVHVRLQAHRPGLILLLLRQGVPLALVKLRLGDGEPLRREGDALDEIGGLRPRSFVAPEVIVRGDRGGWYFLALTPLPPGIHRPVKKAPLDDITREIREGLARLSRPSGTPSHWRAMHGDFTPWNLRRAEDGALVLFDWEDAGWGPPGADEVLYRAAACSLWDEPLGQLEGREAAEFWLDRIRRAPAGSARDEKLAASLLTALEQIRRA